MAEKTWQEMVMGELREPEQPPHLRASGLHHCIRALAYIHKGTPVSDPPQQDDYNKMALGNMAEILIIKNMEDAGWETKHTICSPEGQLEVKIPLPDGERYVPGHPDGLCRHPVYTRNAWLDLECKSMGVRRGAEVRAHGVKVHYPGYIVQIALYAQELHRMGLTEHPHHGVFGLMDRDGNSLPPDRATWEADTAKKALEKAAKAAATADSGDLPDRPFHAGSTECNMCEFRTLCRGKRPPRTAAMAPIESDEKLVLDAAAEWLEARPSTEHAKAVLQQTSDNLDGRTVAAGEVLAGYFEPRNRPKYDSQQLEEKVPLDILRTCLNEGPPDRGAFWIRQKRS